MASPQGKAQIALVIQLIVIMEAVQRLQVLMMWMDLVFQEAHQ